MTDPFPYQEIPHEKLSEIAVNLARERDRLAGQVAAYRELHGPLPLNRTVAASNRLDFSSREMAGNAMLVDWPPEDCADHLVERYRPAEGADFPHPDERANDPRWPLAMCVVVVVALSLAGWMAVPWIWRGVVWAWGVVT